MDRMVRLRVMVLDCTSHRAVIGAVYEFEGKPDWVVVSRARRLFEM